MNVVIKVSSPYLCLEKNGILQAFPLWLNSQWVKGESLILEVGTSEHRAITRGQGEKNQGIFLGVSGGQALKKVSWKLRMLKLISLQWPIAACTSENASVFPSSHCDFAGCLRFGQMLFAAAGPFLGHMSLWILMGRWTVKIGGRWWCTPLIPALGRQRQAELCEFEVSLVYKS